MSTLYQRALRLSSVVVVAAFVSLALSVQASRLQQQHLAALAVEQAVDDASLATAELARTRQLGLADSAAAALRRGAAAADALPEAESVVVRQALTDYEASVGRLRAALSARGVNEQSGAEGLLRDRVHAVEAQVEGRQAGLLVPVLQARRREKDYLLRGDPRYVPRVRAHVAEARRAAGALMGPAEAGQVTALLDDYEQGFLELVQLAGVVEAESRRIGAAGAVARRAAGEVSAYSGRRSRRYDGLSLVAALLSALVVGGGVLYQARGITIPVARLRGAALRVARGERTVRVPVEGPEEIQALAAALNGVADYADRTVAAERDLAEAQRFLSTVLGQAEEGIVVLDPEYRVTYLNPYAERLYGTTRADAVGRRPDLLSPAILAAGCRAHFERALRGEVVQPGDIELGLGRRTVWIAATYAPLVTEGDAVRGVVASFHDVTNRVANERALRQAKDEAESAVRLKAAFLANMSHEIRTPLTGILGYADLLADEAPPGISDLAHVIQRSGQRLLNTLNSVLDLAQLESGAMPVRLGPVDASALCRQTAELYASYAESAGLGLRAEIEPGVEVVADAPALGRILDNLVSNAVKFTPEGHVAVRLWTEGGSALVEVSDTGIGMSPAFQRQMFDEFVQASDGHARTHEGNGLGLTIVHRLAALVGADLDVESALGQGTTVRLRLPLAGGPAVPLAPAAPPAAAEVPAAVLAEG